MNEFHIILPSIPQHIQFLFRNRKGCEDFNLIQFPKEQPFKHSFVKQVVPRVGRPTVMLTVNKQMGMKKKEIMNN